MPPTISREMGGGLHYDCWTVDTYQLPCSHHKQPIHEPGTAQGGPPSKATGLRTFGGCVRERLLKFRSRAKQIELSTLQSTVDRELTTVTCTAKRRVTEQPRSTKYFNKLKSTISASANDEIEYRRRERRMKPTKSESNPPTEEAKGCLLYTSDAADE